MLRWTHRNADPTVEVLEACSTCRLIGVMCNSRQDACAIDMKQPTRASWTRLKRLARYLAGTQAAKVVLMRHGADRDAHEAFFCESGSTVIGLGVPRTEKVNRVLKLKLMVARCIPHQARAHSSSEAEYYATVSATSEAMLIREVLLFLELEVRTELLLDSAGARGICRREGVGTIRHLSTKVLWLQQLVRRGIVMVSACTCAENRADLLNKVTSCPQAATAEAVERSGVKWNRDFGKR